MFSLAEILTPALQLNVLDIGAMPEGVPRYQPLADNFATHVVGFEPNQEQFQKLAQDANVTYLPYFLGDGQQATFHVTRYPGCCSLYRPNAAVIDLFETIGCAEPGGNFHVTGTEQVATVRLDDVYPLERCDFIKADVQGAELDILKHGVAVLESTLVIETEAAFVELYEGQPLFGDLQVYLREHGFVLHKMLDIAGRTFRPLQRGDNPFAPISQMLWADAIFVRDFSKLENFDAAGLLRAAAILHDMYLSYDLVLMLLAEHDRRHQSGYGLAYQNAVKALPELPIAYLSQRLNP